ncbi:MAG: PD40 domain-containing protein [Flavobacteriales bacterium]|nr:PD40 domain-containing protein [Flavobacteriales bacterium]
MPRSLAAFALGLFPLLASAQTAPLWLRQPAISPDGSTIVFCYQGDLWRVPAAGGDAVLLTTHEALDGAPVWSHDGQWIAFSSNRYGNGDVFVMPSAGGTATRLTHHSNWDTPTDFTPDNSKVLFYSNRLDDANCQLFPTGGLGELYTVPITGGRAAQVLTVPAQNARFNASGTMLVFHDRKGYEDNFRKHHTSSVTRDVWTYDLGSKQFKRITTFIGEDRNPVFTQDGSTVYFLTEEKGSYNIHKMPVAGGTSTQVSFLKDHPVRYLSRSDNGTLCFSYQGELHTMTDGGSPAKVSVRIAADGRYNPVRTVPVKGDVTEMALSSNGKEVAFVHRGEVFVTSVAEGTTRRITNTPEQERSVSFSPDGRTLLYATERNASWDLYTSTIVRKEEQYFFNATLLKEEALLNTPAEEFQPAYSPDGKEVAYLEERSAIRVMNLANKQVRTIMPGDKNYSYADGDQFFSWSPDSKWLLVEFLHPDQWITQCGLVNVEGTPVITDLTKSGYGGGLPKWTMDGKAMLFYSSRDGMKNHASWGGQADAYALFLDQEAFDRFKLSKEEAALLKEEEDKKKKEDEEEKKDKKDGKSDKDKDDKKDEPVKPLKFDLEDVELRKVRLTMHSSDLAGAVLSKDGEKLFYLARFEKGYDLWQTELRTGETKVLAKMNASNAGALELDKEGKFLFLSKDGGIAKVEIEKGELKNVGINGEMTLNEDLERAYLFEHVWRQVQKKFYRADLQGVNWALYKEEYARMLPFINNNWDFAELLSEMLGELNASHTGGRFYDEPEHGDETAALGLLYANDMNLNGLRVEEVIDKSPVVKEGSRIKAGVVIEKIDGQAITPQEDHARLLNRKAGKPTLLSLYDPIKKERWDETVKPISLDDEGELLYQRWVERCRHIVDSLSGGRIGYVHVRGMNDRSYRRVYDEALGRYHDKDGLVVDTRFNGGGWLHDDLATFLAGKTYMRMEPRGQKLGTEPQFKWQKPSAVVMGESNYSDAHLFPVTYKALGIGKLVGMPVPGTGTAVWWERMQSGVVFGIPQVGMIDNAGNFMENTQLEPDVKQALEPGLVSKGRDQQLEAAVKVLLGQ